ncbi:MAG: ASKHA domain-containing protein, partial [Deltaproteobacteria bacterium]|nr:ASKHA domain-containing protein [Deltaproteobacteria bacterium]
LRDQHGLDGVHPDIAALKPLAVLLRRENGLVRPAVLGDEIIAFLPAGVPPLGLAVDMGTTKLAGYLVDLESGEALGAAGRMNPQIAYGEDVMARIGYAMKGPSEAKRLQETFAEGLSELARELCEGCGRQTSEILETVIAGNTCMHHLALGLPVDQLGLAPYVASLSDACSVKARTLGWPLAPGASLHFMPNIAGFVGGDHVAMLLATGLHESRGVTLGLDIGTNTEISLAAGGRLWSCSCASGPAFEGAHIQDGMRAADGAVERVSLGDGEPGSPVRVQTIGGAPPVGVCGSGVLDAVAEMRRAGVIRETGAFVPGSHARLRGRGKEAAFLLVAEGEQGAPRDIVITRKDVNEIQLAKAAIRAGIEELLLAAGLHTPSIDRVVVVGAFGTYLDVESALALGMFPPLPPDRFIQVGNAAGIGARMALLSRRCREEAADLARRVRYVELTSIPHFALSYADALMLP